MKNLIHYSVLLVLLGALTGAVHGALTYSYTGPGAIQEVDGWNGTTVVGDGTTGVFDFTLSGSAIGSISDITVNLKIDGAYTGDLYATLTGGGRTAVLLNRVGLPSDYGNAGFDVTFTTATSPDIHDYQSLSPSYTANLLTGTWSADGRFASPGNGQLSDARDNKLDVFNGADPSGTWTLFVVDCSGGGGPGDVQSFSVSVTAVPEPAETAMAISGLLLGVALLRRPEIRSRLMGLVRR